MSRLTSCWVGSVLSRLLVLVGESGCGKTSLVHAGIIPALRAGLMERGGEDWRIASMRPGDNPFRQLARALNDELPSTGQPATDADVAFLMASLRRGPLGLVEAIAEAAVENTLLIVDQFEEILRHYWGEPG